MIRVCSGGVAAVRKIRIPVLLAAVLCAIVATPQTGWATPGPPSAPKEVTLVAGNASVTVKWLPPFSNGGHKVTEYEVLTYHNDVRLAINEFHSTKLAQRITGLKNGSAYTFTVGARNSAGWSRLSARSTAIIAGTTTPPGKPTAVAGDRRATVSWHAPSSTNGFVINGYRVTPYINGSPGAARVYNTTKTRQVVAGLQNGKPYSFKVSAHNRNGWSYVSVSSSIITPGK
jgi:trimeric autotransporter adhesin